MKRPQINFPVKKDELDLVKAAQIGLMVRDKTTYNRKEAILLLCSEFLEKTYSEDKKSA